METPLHSPPFPGAPLDHGPVDNLQRAHANLSLDEGIGRPALSANWTPISKSSPLPWLFSTKELLKWEAVAKRTHTTRVKTNKRLGQSMLMDHWLGLRPASLPV